MSKATFVQSFSDFLKENVPYYCDINGLVYIEDEHGEEWVYCNYRSHSQKRICVTADSEKAIMTDFFSGIEDAPWITPIDQKIFSMTGG